MAGEEAGDRDMALKSLYSTLFKRYLWEYSIICEACHWIMTHVEHQFDCPSDGSQTRKTN